MLVLLLLPPRRVFALSTGRSFLIRRSQSKTPPCSHPPPSHPRHGVLERNLQASRRHEGVVQLKPTCTCTPFGHLTTCKEFAHGGWLLDCLTCASNLPLRLDTQVEATQTRAISCRCPILQLLRSFNTLPPTVDLLFAVQFFMIPHCKTALDCDGALFAQLLLQRCRIRLLAACTRVHEGALLSWLLHHWIPLALR